MVFTTAGGSPPRTSASRPGTIRGDSTGLDVGARGCPLSEKGDPFSEELNSWQWDMSEVVYLSVPEASRKGVAILPEGRAGVRARLLHDLAPLGHERCKATSDASDSKGGDGGRVRPVVVLSVRSSTCLSCSSDLKRQEPPAYPQWGRR